MTIEEAVTPFLKSFLKTLIKFFIFLAVFCGWLVSFTLNGY